MTLFYQQQVQVASYQVGPNGLARPSALLGFLEDAAGKHAMLWELGLPDLIPRGYTWVIARYALQLARCPRMGEQLAVSTWPSSRSNLFVTRDFEIQDSDAATIALATTTWAVVDLTTKRPVSVTKVVPEGFVLDRHVITDEFPQLTRVETPQFCVELPVMLRDLDMNGHVNHIVYLQWALETVPLDVLKGKSPRRIEISYRAEARLGDKVVASSTKDLDTEPQQDRFVHSVTHAQTGTELARLRTTWE